jgi:hypothetical protein
VHGQMIVAGSRYWAGMLGVGACEMVGERDCTV